MRNDKQVIAAFLRGYAKRARSPFVSVLCPDEIIRDREAVDAIATDKRGKRLAIEHTLLQPFPGQKQTLSKQLATVFEPLKRQAVPGRHIMITVPDDSVKRGQDWPRAAEAIGGWFETVKVSLPLDWSYHVFLAPDLNLEVHMCMECVTMGGQGGCVSITYAHPQMEVQFGDVVAKGVQEKVGKLTAGSAHRRILLFEREWLVYSNSQLAGVLDRLVPRFPGLAQVDEVWVADTCFRARHGYAWFRGVWPDGIWLSSANFRADCDR